MKRIAGILWGLALIAVGVGFVGDVMNVWNFDIFFPGWWTLIIIIPCLISLFKSGPKIFNMFGLVMGALLMIRSFELIGYSVVFQLIMPVLLIVIGIRLIVRDAFSTKLKSVMKQNKDNIKDFGAYFTSSNLNYAGINFLGGNYNAVFGGMEIDLRNAVINSEACITANAVFGGIDILLPPNVRIEVNPVSIFGGTSNNFYQSAEQGVSTIYINTLTIFGGVSIK